MGRMGGNMVKKFLADGHKVVAWNRSTEGVLNLQSKLTKRELKNLQVAVGIKQLGS